ncbi:ADP-ribosylation factor-like protein [Geomonas sp. Red32]|uniref:GTP-binding protein n=1 Tax=Geomonas sp. Red32 TaxID=2912856 RepID=UPI00202CC79C|nr:ADP-ribosylation factor-like protein [Geomonas sp. Red32]MCM0083206.1 ADP-ribosylation factor-like protein [Geomonas sp. Red32]
MALINQAKREINSKIVFFGPGLSGKASTLKHVFNKLKPEFRGVLKAMNVQGARMMFFDFTPPGDGNIDGFKVRFHVYTVSGNAVDPSAWKMVLKGVDGIVFVADSHPQRAEANRESLDRLNEYLAGYGQSTSTLPVVLQYNKSDLKDALSQVELDAMLNLDRVPSFRASSYTGDGVLQTLLALVKNVLTGMRSKGVDGGVSGDALQHMVEEVPVHAGAGSTAAEVPPPVRESAADRRGRPGQEGGTPSAPEPVAPAASPVAAAAPAAEAPAAAAPAAMAPAFEEQVPAPPAEPPQPAAPVAVAEDITLELSGTPQAAGQGAVRIPLTIRSGNQTKSVSITLSLSIEDGR